ncbi:MAG: glycerophosphodiester phosphodiesterase [Myxococcota bacterium]
MPAGSNANRPCIGFAHRGASADARENTLAAFRLALELGATGLESDVWLTADGVPVLDHDGLTPGGVAIPSVERRALPEHVPTLAELYETCGSDFELSLDVMHPEAARAVVAVARAAASPARLWLCHWNWRVVAGFRELDPDVRLVDSTRVRVMGSEPGERAERMVALGIDALNLHWSDWTEALGGAFRARGRVLLGWDAQDDTALARLLALGMDAVFSDHVPLMMRAIRAGAATPGR